MRYHSIKRRRAPQAVHLLGEGGDPDVVMVGVRYAKDGYCSGQFTVRATETVTEVRIDDVVNREMRFGGACAGLGTADGMAWAELRLAAPLGQRRAVRAADGVELPIS